YPTFSRHQARRYPEWGTLFSHDGDGCSPSFLKESTCLQQAKSMRIDRLAFCSEARSRRNVRSSGSLSSARCSARRSASPKRSIGCTRSTLRPSLRTKRAVVMVDRYRKKIAAMVIQMAKDDPQLVKE